MAHKSRVYSVEQYTFVCDPDSGVAYTDTEGKRVALYKQRVRKIIGPNVRTIPNTLKQAERQAKRNRKAREQRNAARKAYHAEYDARYKVWRQCSGLCPSCGKISDVTTIDFSGLCPSCQ
jgi:hypothetical protein